MKVLSLFDGISAGKLALERANINVDVYYRSEIDKYANTIAKKNYPDSIDLGDVTNWRTWDIDWSGIDLLIGGSPCQGFSFAGKQLAFDDPRSKLFFVYVDILNHIKSVNPTVKFMLENVRMKKEFLGVITENLCVEPVLINSALVSAQNRQRYYWANWKIRQPKDRGILLKDIIDTGEVDREKSYCIDASYHKGGNPEQYFNKSRRQLVFKVGDIKGGGQGNRVYHIDGKSPCLSSQSGGTAGAGAHLITGGAIRGRYIKDGKRQDHKIKTAGLTEQRLEIRSDEKTNTLTTVQKDNLLIMVGMASDIKGHDSNRRVYNINGKSPTLLASSGGHKEPKITEAQDGESQELLSGVHYRKLTTIECERLQTFPDNYTDGVSNTQRYKMLGNSWTVDVIAHLFKELIGNNYYINR